MERMIHRESMQELGELLDLAILSNRREGRCVDTVVDSLGTCVGTCGGGSLRKFCLLHPELRVSMGKKILDVSKKT